MSDTQIIVQNLTGTYNQGGVMPGAWSAKSFGTLQYGAPVFIAGPAVVNNAFAAGNGIQASCIGLSLRECDAAGQSTYVTPPSGPVDLSTQQWDNVTGQVGGLSVGATYYVSAVTPGKLTTVAPNGAGQFIIAVGVGRDPTTMIMNIQISGAQAATPQPIIE